VLALSGLHRRAAFLRLIRQFFETQGFVEIDTPLRLPIVIPERHIELISAEGQYLQASPELCMKRVLARGAARIFQLAQCFRKGERGRRHLEEFLLLEWYRSGCDYRRLMTDCIELCRFIYENWSREMTKTGGPVDTAIFPDLDLFADWQRLTVEEAFARYSPVCLGEALRTGRFDELLCEFVEPQLGLLTPTFLCDYPAELASLSRLKPGAPGVAERFELYSKGIELANGFSELIDQREQRQRFGEEIAAIRESTGRELIMPEPFLRDLEEMPEAAGIALGVDRLMMIAFGLSSISQVVILSPADFC